MCIQFLKKLPIVMEYDGSSPSSQNSATEHYLELPQCSARLHVKVS
jgi:hypothetical protein